MSNLDGIRYRDLYEERAAILEYDAGMSRFDAENAARAEIETMDLSDTFVMTAEQFQGLSKRKKLLVKEVKTLPPKEGDGWCRVMVKLKQKVWPDEFPKIP